MISIKPFHVMAGMVGELGTADERGRRWCSIENTSKTFLKALSLSDRTLISCGVNVNEAGFPFFPIALLCQISDGCRRKICLQ